MIFSKEIYKIDEAVEKIGFFAFILGLVSSFSPSYAWILVFRFFVGFGIGVHHKYLHSIVNFSH